VNINILADIGHSCGYRDRAEAGYRAALEIRQRLLDPEHPEIASLYNNLATVLHEGGRYTEAEHLLVRARTIARRHLAADHPLLTSIDENLAGCRARTRCRSSAWSVATSPAARVRNSPGRPDPFP
jgi:tetratricopeptide (TPR) repeat protein